MNLNELYQPTPDGYRTDRDDNTVRRSDENRRREARITLAKLNKLRIMNDARKVEHEEKLEGLKDQYRPPQPDAGGMPPM